MYPSNVGPFIPTSRMPALADERQYNLARVLYQQLSIIMYININNYRIYVSESLLCCANNLNVIRYFDYAHKTVITKFDNSFTKTCQEN